MGMLVDTSVWSLAYRRDTPGDVAHVAALRAALTQGETVTTGVIFAELLRGFVPATVRDMIASDFRAVTVVEPAWDDYEAAADIATQCRAHGVQLTTIDALIAQLAIRHRHTLLTTDQDFSHAALHIPLPLWKPSTP